MRWVVVAVLVVAWQLVLHINIALPISPLWVLVPLALLLPPYALYASSVKSTVFVKPLLDERRAKLIARITGAKSVVFGHTHEPCLELIDKTVTVMNPGSAGAPRLGNAPSVGIMELEPGIPPRARLVPLGRNG